MSPVHIDELNPETGGRVLAQISGTEGGTPSLVKYDAARAALERAHTVDEVKDIRDKAEALRAYAKQAKDIDMQNWAAEIRVRAERRAGEILLEMTKSGERDAGKGGDRKSQSHASTVKLSDLGISKDHASRWQRLAEIPAETYERYLREAQDTKSEITAAGLLRAYTKTLPVKPHKEDDSWSWGEELDNALEHAIFCIKSLQGRGPREQEAVLTEKLQTLPVLIAGLLEKIA
jgi:hypothetical protein